MKATEIVHVETRALTTPSDGEWTVEQIVAQTLKIQQCMSAVMKRDEHYGVIPGTARDGKPGKPTLLKPGAEKLCLMFRLCPEYETLRAEQSATLVSYTIRCRLTHIPTGNLVATGLGSCNSRENKYVRPAPKKCPACNGEFLIVGKPEYERDPEFKGGMICYAKKGGCGARYKPGDEAIDKQPTGIADPSDLDNTILKMACKRSLVAAVLNGTAASDCFTQDLEDLTEKAAEYIPPPVAESPERLAGRQEAPQDAGKASGTNAAPSSSVAAGTAPTGGAQPVSASKPRAVPGNRVPHEGRPATKDQIAKLHALKRDVGGLTDEAYRKQLRAFKRQDGTPAEHSNELSVNQIGNLLGRYQAQIQRQSQKAAEGVDIAAVAPALPRAKPDARATVPRNLDDELMRAFNGADDEATWLHGLFGVTSVKELSREEQGTALQLLLSFGTPGWDDAETKAREAGLIR